MSYQNESFGMMDPGYFVPRGEILNWLNDLLKLNLTKIQQLGSGAVYCQIVDVIHPNKVTLAKVNWKARNDYQFINNLKILQNAFDKIGIKKHVQVQKLAKAKYQDNLQFIQWLKRYYDMNCGERGNNYMAQQRRGNVPIDLSFGDKSVVPKVGGKDPKAANIQSEKVQKPKPTGLTVNTNAKVQDMTSRIKSPVQSKRVQFKQQVTTTKKTETRPTLTKTAKTETKQATDERQESEKIIQRVIQKQTVIQYRTDPKLEAQLEQAFIDLQDSRGQSQRYQKIIKQLNVKLEMIKQILISEDDANMKVSLIEQIFKE